MGRVAVTVSRVVWFPLMADPAPTLHDLLRELREQGTRMKRIALDVEALTQRMGDFEVNAYRILRDGLSEVVTAVENFAATKATGAKWKRCTRTLTT